MKQIMADAKKKLRKEILHTRNAMPVEERLEKSEKLLQTLYSMELYQSEEVILAYVDYQSEVVTLPFIEKALMDGKRVFCPKVMGDEMEFYRINNIRELEEGYKGIREPKVLQKFVDTAGNQQTVKSMRRPLALIPGVVFDRSCHRIGYGKGFYDKYLTRLSENGIKVYTVGLGYECQMVSEAPCEAHDIKLDMVVTERAIYR